MTRPPREPDLESGFPSPTIVDSRRLMGPNLLHAGLGAVLDVALDDAKPEHNARLLTAWHERVSFLADALGWPDAETVQRIYAGGASLFVTAPIDQLMTATEVCEQAWVFAESLVAGTATPDSDVVLASLTAFGRTEARGALRAIWDEGVRLGLNVTFDEAFVGVGSGVGGVTFSLDALPHVDAIDWPALRDIPIVLVTGSNGKTTVVRMVAAMARAAGHTVGYTCTDGVWVGDKQVESGDYSGPAGARRVLQDATVTFAVLETARGGILRRGLAVQRASAAAIVTLSPDHFGDYGITDLTSLAEAKMVAARAVVETGTLVFNADVPTLVTAIAAYEGRVVPIRSGDPTPAGIVLEEIPATLHGAAAHNVLNARIALAIADAVGIDGMAARTALQAFGSAPRDNTGRLMTLDVGGVTVVVDYAHNPQSVASLIHATAQLPAGRRAITLGTGGDRDDLALLDIAHAAADSGLIDFYIAKEMPRFLRGRPPGSISQTLITALAERNVPESQRITAADDMLAARAALQWAQEHDLILLNVHDQREAVLAFLADLAQNGWHPGTPLPM